MKRYIKSQTIFDSTPAVASKWVRDFIKDIANQVNRGGMDPFNSVDDLADYIYNELCMTDYWVDDMPSDVANYMQSGAEDAYNIIYNAAEKCWSNFM